MRTDHGIIPYIELHATGAPLYLQLYMGLRDAIVDGRIPPETRLPSSRTLAADMGLARMTITRAYSLLKADGYLEAGVGSGTWVSASQPERPPRRTGAASAGGDEAAVRSTPRRRTLSARGRNLVSLIGDVSSITYATPFTPGLRTTAHFPHRTWAAIERKVRRKSDAVGSAELAGDERLRVAVAHSLSATRGGTVDPERVVVTPGSREALSILADLLLDPADAVVFEDPGNPVARAIFEEACRVVPVPVDAEGLTIPPSGGKSPAALAFVSPSSQWPLGVTMSLRRRRELLEWAAGTDAWIVEDDYDGFFRFEGRPLPSLASLDADDRVIYLGGFQKLLEPVLEGGFAVLPEDLVQPFLARLSLQSPGHPTLTQRVLARFIEEGHFARHVRAMRDASRAARDVLVDVLREEADEEPDLTIPDAGGHLVLWMPPETSASTASARLAEMGVTALPVSRFAHGPTDRDGLVLGYDGFELEALAQAARKIPAALRLSGVGTSAPGGRELRDRPLAALPSRAFL